MQLVNAKARVHGTDFKAYGIDNQSLFVNDNASSNFNYNVVQMEVSGE